MRNRCQRTQYPSIADDDVGAPEPLEQRCGKRIDLVMFVQVERHQCRRSADCADPIIDFFKPADGACDQHDMRAGSSQGNGGGGTQAARRAGYYGNAAAQTPVRQARRAQSAAKADVAANLHQNPSGGLGSHR